MVCRPCQAAGTRSEVAYGIRIIGEGNSCRKRQKGRVQCKDYRDDMVCGLMAGYMRTQHGRAMEGRRSWEATPADKDLQTYRMAFPTAGGPRNCPVEVFLVQATTWTVMRVHFLHLCVQYTVVILEYGNLPQPHCPRCDILVPWCALKRRHLSTAQYARGVEQKRRRMAKEEL